MHELAREHPRFGYRRIVALLRREGWSVNPKRLHRLWRQAGLQVRRKQRKRRRVGTGENGTIKLKPLYPNHVWSYDFLFDFVVGVQSSSSSNTRFVDTMGSDIGNDCTVEAFPCATITHAVSMANNGDILEVASGTYNEPGLVIDKNLDIRWHGVVVIQ